MAIYHLSMQNISRGKGKNAVSAAAYRAGELIKDENQDLTFDYRKKRVDETFILAPEDAPEWVKDRSILWNTVEKNENRKNSRLAKEFNVALPIELSPEKNKELGLDFCKKMFVEKGIVADVAFHGLKTKNPHFHVMLVTREMTKDEGFTKKNREWDKVNFLEDARSLWADMTNERLKENNIDQVIHHKSLKRQGIDLEPTRHERYGEKGKEDRKRNDAIKRRNVAKLRLVEELKEVKKEANLGMKEVLKMEIQKEQKKNRGSYGDVKEDWQQTTPADEPSPVPEPQVQEPQVQEQQERKEYQLEHGPDEKKVVAFKPKQEQGYGRISKVMDNINSGYKENINTSSLLSKRLSRVEGLENRQKIRRNDRLLTVSNLKVGIKQHEQNLIGLKDKKASIFYKIPFSPYRKKVKNEIRREKIGIKQKKKHIQIEKLKMKNEKVLLKETVQERKKLTKETKKVKQRSARIGKALEIVKKIETKIERVQSRNNEKMNDNEQKLGR